MLVLNYVIQLLGATMLLLFAVRMVRTGIEREFGTTFRRLVTTGRPTILLTPIGMMLALLLQSSAAVTLLVSGLASSGSIAFAPGLAIVLGADLGSALVVQILSLRLDWLVPVLLSAGGILFLKTERRDLRQTGRIILGVALILISLDLLRNAMEPISSSRFLPGVASYLERDFLTAFFVGAGLAFVMHSSVAAILMCVTIVAIGALPFSVGVSLVLGANLGSALIPVWLSRGYPPDARRIPLASLVIRGFAAIAALFLFNGFQLAELQYAANDAQNLLSLHIAFNFVLLAAIPICPHLEGLISAVYPRKREPGLESNDPKFRSILTNDEALSTRQALANLRREVMRMAGVVSDMLAPVMQLYAKYDQELANKVTKQDEVVNIALDGIRIYVAALPLSELTRPERKEMRALVDYAIALEAAGDIIVKRLLPLADKLHKDAQTFSVQGREELEHLHQRSAANLEIATNVLVSSDTESARLLMEEKAEMNRLERRSRKRHLRRLNQGDANSLQTSDAHIETAYLIKELNSWIVTVAHPILEQEGQLLRSRLIEPEQIDLPSD